MHHTLDVLTMPLVGQHLIEASAGTGKTWTLSALYVRLILGHGEVVDIGRGLLPPDILVMTFTDAATAELRDRIRKRCDEAAAAFRGRLMGDAFLQSLIEDFPVEQHATCARRLELAVQWMDEAAIFTIHGWCHRMLRQHAFDSVSLFDIEAIEDTTLLLQTVVKDYWRDAYYPLSVQQLEAIQPHIATPDALQKAIRPLMDACQRQPNACQASIPSISDIVAPWLDWKAGLNRLETFAQQQWQAGARAAIEQPNIKLKGGTYKSTLFDAIDAWAIGDSVDKDFYTNKLSKFTFDALHAAKNKGSAEVPQHAAFDAINALVEHLNKAPDIQSSLLNHATQAVILRYENHKVQHGLFDFQDLLTQLYTALHHPECGDALAQRIRQQYPIALVDEFQDTDVWQYGSFANIYEHQPNTAFLMVGDPKQAIYRFRGADINTYLTAKRATEAHHTLGVNFRSTKGVVDAVNALFERAENYPQGAFLLKDDGGEDPIPFAPVDAQGRDDVFIVDGVVQPALSVWGLNEGKYLSKSAYIDAMADICAAEMTRLLNAGAQGHAYFGDVKSNGVLRSVQPKDMSVLVRNSSEARVIRQALAKRQVKSVYLSDRSNVLETDEALDMWRWLRAVAEPNNVRLIKAAIASKSYGLSSGQLAQLSEQDEDAWDAQIEQFRQWFTIWQRQGVLPMLYRLLHDRQLPQLWLRETDGERKLTNMLHLAELLQAASVTVEGEASLIRWFETQMQTDNPSAKQLQVRLESDADLVKVITIHKSKGLEYPLVFLPFMLTFREEKETPEANDIARLQEDVRLLYVALTRAQHALWLGVCGLAKASTSKENDLPKTALGYLLNSTSNPDNKAWQAPFKALFSQYQAFDTDSDVPCNPYIPCHDSPRLEEALSPDHQPWPLWRMSSYSAITHQKASIEQQHNDAVLAEETRQQVIETAFDATAIAHFQGEWQSIKGSAALGTLLHDCLEFQAKVGWEMVDSKDWIQFVDAQMARLPLPVLTTEQLTLWLMQIIHYPMRLSQQTVKLADIAQQQLWAEMDFHLPLSSLKTPQLDALVSQMILPALPRAALGYQALGGMLKGFMDLVFEHQGQYFVLDYKSNKLSSYDTQSLNTSMLAERYDVQAALYIVALHRLLGVRLPDYDYDRHIGGAVYIYLRGVDQQDTSSVWFAKPDRHYVEALDALLAGRT